MTQQRLGKSKIKISDFQKNDLAHSVNIMRETQGKLIAKKAKIDFMEGLNPKTHEYTFLKRKVIKLNNKPIAICGVYQLKTHPRHVFGVCWFGIKKKYQKNGLGTKLLKWVIAESKKHKKKYLIVWLTKNAFSFYRQFGFKESTMKVTPKEARILLVKKI